MRLAPDNEPDPWARTGALPSVWRRCLPHARANRDGDSRARPSVGAHSTDGPALAGVLGPACRPCGTWRIGHRGDHPRDPRRNRPGDCVERIARRLFSWRRGRAMGGEPKAGDDAGEVGLFAPGHIPVQSPPDDSQATALDRWFYGVVQEATAPWGQARTGRI